MNKILLVLLVVVAYSSAQIIGGDVGAVAGVGVNGEVAAQTVEQTELTAAERRQALRDARIARRNQRRESLAAKRARKQEQRLRAQEARRARLEARRQLQAEQYAQGAEFQNVDAAVSRDSSKTFALSILDQEQSSQNVAISASSGSQFANGARVGLNEALSADQQSASEVEAEQNAASLDQVEAQRASDDQLSAAERVQQENQANLRASDGSASSIAANNQAAGGRAVGGGIIGR